MFTTMSPMRCIIFTYIFSFVSVAAQEKPSIEAKLYNPWVIYRQNLCDHHAKYYKKQVELRNAFQGVKLRPLIIVTRLFQLEDGALNEKDPGIIVEILDELSQRARFTWRTTFAIAPDGPGEGHSYTDLYFWGAETFDVVVDWCLNSLERLKLGIGFPKGFYDGSYILVGEKRAGTSERANLFSWLEPFKPLVWWAFLATILVSTVAFATLENIYNKVDYRSRLRQNVFYSFMIFAQHFEFHPKANGARVFSLSLAFWSLILASTYTANLVTFFVVPDAQHKINSIDDVIAARLPICVEVGAGVTDYVVDTYKKGIFIDKKTTDEAFHGIKDGDCVFALTTVQSWNLRQRDRNINGECDLTRIGRVIKFVDAGFAVKADSHVLCTSLIQDVLNLHIYEMIEDGFVDRLWKKTLRRSQDIDCETKTNHDSDGVVPPKLTLNEMSGTFLLHFLCSILAITITILFTKLRSKNRGGKEEVKDKVVVSHYINNPASLHKHNFIKLEKQDNAEALLDLETQLKVLGINLRVMERSFFYNLIEERQHISKILSMVTDIQNAHNETSSAF